MSPGADGPRGRSPGHGRPESSDKIRYSAKPGSRSVPDPVSGLLIYRGRGGTPGTRPPCRPRPASGAEAISLKDVFWTDDIRQVAEADQESAAKHNVRQVLTVPLLSSEGR